MDIDFAKYKSLLLLSLCAASALFAYAFSLNSSTAVYAESGEAAQKFLPSYTFQDAWTNRYRAFAEGVVIMVCPVLLAITLKKVDLKSEEHGRAVPTTMLVVATVTLLAGICPFLVCSFSKRFFSGSSSDSPHTATKLLAPLSGTCLVALACWIIYLILDSWALPLIGALIGLCSVIRTVMHFTTTVEGDDAATVVRCKKYGNRLESSLDFLAGITALLFLGLEGLALEGQLNSTKTIHNRLTKPIGTSFVVCVVGVSLMLVETMPPRKLVRNLTETIDILTGFAVALVMFFIMYALMELRALLLLVAPFLILMMYVFYAAISMDDGQGNNTQRGAANGEESAVRSSADSDKPASLELTKVTFTGFLAVSIPSISKGSVSMSTECFLHLAATAIVSGLVWRILTHYKSQTTIATTIADIASFCTHLCVAVATIPFTVMARNALS